MEEKKLENIQQEKTDNSILILEFGISEKGYEFNSDLKTELDYVDQELYELSSKLEENIGSIKKLTPECDKIDYSLASCSGCLSGIIDIILVGKPGESYLGNLSDKWVEKRIMDFAKICGWNDNNKKSISSAIRFLENKFKIPYDQRGVGDAGSAIFDLNPKNHHFKSLGHNPNLLGLFFSILNQFTNTSHFVSEGIYKLSRNPMYVGLACCLVSWAIWLSYLLPWLGVVLFIAYMTRFQIIPEERVLRQKFGDEYQNYCLKVRRWL